MPVSSLVVYFCFETKDEQRLTQDNFLIVGIYMLLRNQPRQRESNSIA